MDSALGGLGSGQVLHQLKLTTDLPFTKDNCRTSLLPDMASGNRSPSSTNSPRAMRPLSCGEMAGSPAELAEQTRGIRAGCPRGRGADSGAGDGAMGKVVGTTMFDSKRSRRG